MLCTTAGKYQHTQKAHLGVSNNTHPLHTPASLLYNTCIDQHGLIFFHQEVLRSYTRHKKGVCGSSTLLLYHRLMSQVPCMHAFQTFP